MVAENVKSIRKIQIKLAFTILIEKLGERPFVIERQSGLKEEVKSKWNPQ